MSLTRAQRDVIAILTFRRSLGDCWLVDEPRQRHGLVVPTMMTDRHLEYLRSFNAATLRGLHAEGLIEYGPNTDVPRFGYRSAYHKKWTRLTGCTVRLTEAATP